MFDQPGQRSILRGGTVLITGHSGFIGSWLSMMLHLLGAQVVGYSQSDDPVTAARATWLGDLGIPQTAGDVRDLRSLMAAVEAACPDVVVHLAAQPLLGRGYSTPHLTFDVNINGSLNILEVARRGLTTALVHVTSDKCYDPAEAGLGAITESSPLGGRSPYPASKTIAELLFREFAELAAPARARPRLASVRLGNVIGGGDEADRLVPNCLRAFRAGMQFAVRDPQSVRPFQHVLDVVAGLVRLAECLISGDVPSGEAINFAPPACGNTTGELVSELALAWGPPALLNAQADLAPFPEQQVLRLDGAKAAALLGWSHALDLTDSARWTVDWVRAVDAGAPPAAATRAQASRFLSKLAVPA